MSKLNLTGYWKNKQAAQVGEWMDGFTLGNCQYNL